MKVTNTVSNLLGEDRDVVAMRERIKNKAHKAIELKIEQEEPCQPESPQLIPHK